MTLVWGITILCLTVLLAVGAIAWMTISRLRDQRNASEIVPLEVAVCIQKENGDVIIRQRREKSVLGLVLGILIMLGGLAMLVAQVSNTAELGLQALCAGVGLLMLGILTTWVSGRGFREPGVVISVANRTVEIRRGIFGGTQIWHFSNISGVVRQSRLREDVLLSISGALIDPRYMSPGTNRTIISLRHSDGQEVRLCTVTKEATERVPVMLATAMGKPVFAK